MNQYLFLRRMRGPIFLLIFGVTALLDEYTGISYSMSWPLYIIAWGVIKLAENAILAQNPLPPPGQFPYAGYPGAGAPGAPGGTSASNPQSTAIVPATGEDRG
ncbi:MAG TPA: hypothetical protein VKT75_11950 [Acidobacteriaceae bacterium]|nr:hypothetical protein [Acidobacteriaceae bacterium]